jgi:hypothetical protein
MLLISAHILIDADVDASATEWHEEFSLPRHKHYGS